MRSKDRGLMERIKSYVEEYALSNNGETPTMRDIGANFKMCHTTAYRYLVAMDELGMVRYERGRISTDIIDKMDRNLKFAPSFSGAIPAGPADEVEASVEEYVPIPTAFTNGLNGDYYILTVTGDSMISANIDSGDLVIIRKQVDARPGDIVAALIENRSTLKRLREDDEGVYLWAENETWSDDKRFYGRRFEVQGVAVKVVKDIV